MSKLKILKLSRDFRYLQKLALKSTRLFCGQAVTLLSSKVADSSIASQKKERESSDTTNNSTTTHNLQETKIAGLQYLGGYVLHKLYRKNAKANRKESQ